MRRLVGALVLAVVLAGCASEDPGSTTTTVASPSTVAPATTVSPSPPTTVLIGQFCDDADAGRTTTAYGVTVTCVYNPASARHHWVAVTTTSPAPTTPAKGPLERTG